MNSKIKLAGLGIIAAGAAIASPYMLKIQEKPAIAAADIAPAAGSDSNFSAAQKTELDGIIKDYLLKNPEVLMESVNNYRTNQQKAEEGKAADALKENLAYLHGDTLPDVGNKKGDVVVVEFFDYNCGYCKQAYEAVQEGLNQDKNLRFVFVDLPILSESSKVASKYALAAQKQGKYFELHQALMKFKGPKSDETILKLAADAGLNVDKLKTDLNDPSIEATLSKNQELAQKLAISGTPGFIIGDEIVRGYVPYNAMKTIIDTQRKKQG